MRKTIAIATALLLAACGGGGGGGGADHDDGDNGGNNGGTSPSASAEGQYNGTTSRKQSTSFVVLDDQRFYALYSVPGSSATIAGFVVGTVASSDGQLNNGSGIDYNFLGDGVNNVSLKGSYTPRASVEATVAYDNGDSTTLQARYDSRFDATSTLAAISGNYTGISAIAPGSEAVNLSIDASGNVSGQGSSACAFTGTVAAHGHGNVYDVAIQFGGSPCAYANQRATGIAVMPASNSIRVALQTGAKDGVLLVASK